MTDLISQVTIKPLVWVWHGTIAVARTAQGPYFECTDLGKNWDNDRFVLRYSGTRVGAFSTEDTAKAVAQADYEARIMSAIDVQPDPRDAVIKGLQRQLLRYGEHFPSCVPGPPCQCGFASAALAAAKAVLK